MLAKNQTVHLVCERLGADLEGVCHHEGQAVFVPGALPGEHFDAHILQVRPNYAFAKIARLVQPSPDRREPFCPVYVQCGGCSGQHMSYAATLEAKRQQVVDCLTRIGGLSLTPEDVPPVLGAGDPTHYRNKTSLPVGGSVGHPLLGFYKRRSHEIVAISDCPVAMGSVPNVLTAVREWMVKAAVPPYQEVSGQGLLRHVVIRTVRGGDVLVLLVATSEKLPTVDRLVEHLKAQVPGFAALHVSENRMRNNVILGSTCRKLYGADAILETLLGLTFEISPLSFFQVNPAQTERLYQQAIDFAALGPEDTVVDAYAGAGTISLCMAKRCKRVIGLEIVPQAVESAQRNAVRNGVANAEFLVDSVEDRLPKLVSMGLRPDVIMLDPPRKGVEPQVI
ncbi:MAG TPA: 23S rRNA (uracil(1939)-C(5))-methyltransferase RlmD, partial [Candidatus Limiplasma sp.]|nr:23S rRNA (uracil(1939)-C(5))-methyltransferase RlmD [Candidatus Limiplasma sp.]